MLEYILAIQIRNYDEFNRIKYDQNYVKIRVVIFHTCIWMV